MVSSGVTAVELTLLAQSRARAEAAELSAMLDFHDAEWDAAGEADEHFRRQAERSMIALEIGQAIGLSEAQVGHRLAMARRVRNQTPATWMGFLTGRIDAARIQLISSAIEELERPESVERLDARVVSYAETHTLAEVKRWLRDFVNRVESDLALERAEAERDERYVQVVHGDEGMSWLNAYLPSATMSRAKRGQPGRGERQRTAG